MAHHRNGQTDRMRNRRITAALATGLAVAVLLAAAGLLAFTGHGLVPGAAPSSAPATTGLPTPAGTGVVARLSTGSGATFSWSPDGAHLLVSDGTGSRVYDRFGHQVSVFPSVEGWLDTSHLIGGDGAVVGIVESRGGSSPPSSQVVASGHGSAAVIVARPRCVGDPIVDWYRDGRFEQSHESVTPFGWSADGRLAVLGHMPCGSMDAEQHGWKGSVQVVEFATGHVVATVPDVRGELAFSPSGDDLAAQSDADLEVADLGTGDIDVLHGLRFLGWLDDETLYGEGASGVEVVDLDPPSISTVIYQEWQAESPTGLHIAADVTGAARRIVATDGTTLMDLSLAGLIAESYPPAGQPVVSSLQQSWWSPDGRMLALQSADGASLVLISVDPARPASSASP